MKGANVVKPKSLDPITEIKVERADYFAQRAKAQEEIAMYQSALNGANQRFLLADGAAQACDALLKKLEIPDETPTPSAP